MADFRRWFTVLAVLALFAGLASAQVGNGGQQQNPAVCSTQTVTPQLRSEGYTEETGDIVITCTGGAVTQNATQISQANIVVNLNAPVTSRLLSGSNTEALLLIDEPGSGLTGPINGFGPTAPQIYCNAANSTGSIGGPANGCVEYAWINPANPVAAVAVNCSAITNGAPCSGNPPNLSHTPGPNMFQGVLTGSQQVTFYGVPILPPATTGLSRVFRITNIRVNANFLGSGQATAAISTNGSTSLPLNNSSLTVGFVQASLTTSVSGTNKYLQCNSVTRSPGYDGSLPSALLTFKELFGTAFKTRVMPYDNSNAYSAQETNTGAAGSGLNQNIPGTLYFSESNFIQPTVTNSSGTSIAGLADYGTRLKAVFNNIPTGVNVFVTFANVNANGFLAATAPSPIGGGSKISYAQLVVGETQSDGIPPSFPAVSSGATTFNSITTRPLTVTNGQAIAVWEVVNDDPNSIDTLNFGVYFTYTASPQTNTPPAPATAVVNLSYAPTATQGAFTTAAAGVASSTLSIPRFVDTSTASTVMTINICQTALLYPYVTAYPGFDTGIAIANTSTDTLSFGPTSVAPPQHGVCALNFYGSTTTATGTGVAPSQFVTPDVPTGTVYSTLTSAVPGGQGFTGYVIAVCNFQYAHGYAAVSDVGARNFVTSYLALVMNAYQVIAPRGLPAETWAH